LLASSSQINNAVPSGEQDVLVSELVIDVTGFSRPGVAAFRYSHTDINFWKRKLTIFLLKVRIFIQDRTSTRLNPSHVSVSYAVLGSKQNKRIVHIDRDSVRQMVSATLGSAEGAHLLAR